LKAASALETSHKAWVVVGMRFSHNVYGLLIVFVKKNYLSIWVFTPMQSVHIRMKASLSPP